MATYRAKSLSGAERRVRELLRVNAKTSELLDRYARERRLLAQLAAKTPQFDNPLLVYEAERIRDEILRRER